MFEVLFLLSVEGECFLCCSLDSTVNNFIVSEYIVVKRPVALVRVIQ